MTRLTVWLLTLAAFSAASGQLLFRVGAKGRLNWVDFLNAPIFGGLVLYAVGTALWIYALSFEKLVNVYAFTALTFVLVYLGGAVLLHERVTMLAGIGICAVLGGLYLIINYN